METAEKLSDGIVIRRKKPQKKRPASKVQTRRKVIKRTDNEKREILKTYLQCAHGEGGKYLKSVQAYPVNIKRWKDAFPDIVEKYDKKQSQSVSVKDMKIAKLQKRAETLQDRVRKLEKELSKYKQQHAINIETEELQELQEMRDSKFYQGMIVLKQFFESTAVH